VRGGRGNGITHDPEDRAALIEALKSGRLGGFALDALYEERRARVGLAGLPDAVGEREDVDTGASVDKDQGMTWSGNGRSVKLKVNQTKDEAKKLVISDETDRV